jgi:hypothetical protein
MVTPRSTATDKADLLALLERRRGLDEQDLVADLLTDVVETNHGHARLEKKFRPLLSHGAQLRKSVLH